MATWSAEQVRLSRLLRPTEELLCVAPAVHRTADGLRSRRVWLGVGKTRSKNDYAAFIFTRTRLACAQRLREWIYCVLPLVANIQLDLSTARCVFSWSTKAQMNRLRYQGDANRTPGDCIIEDIDDPAGGVLKVLEESHTSAVSLSLVFPVSDTRTRANHEEYWQYKDAIPLDLAKLQPSQILSSASASRRPNTLAGGRGSVTTSRSESLRFLSVTWNVGATLPSPDQPLSNLLAEEPGADIICLGFQEVCQLSAKRLLKDGEEWQAWHSWADQGICAAFGSTGMELVVHRHLVGLLMLIYVKSSLRTCVSDIRSCAIPTGVGGVGGNKGAVCARFEVGAASLCFVNAHLAAGQEHYIERCQHFRTIIERILFTQEDLDIEEMPLGSSHAGPLSHPNMESEALDAKLLINPPTSATTPVQPSSVRVLDRGKPNTFNGGNTTQAYNVHDHDHIFWLGDTNSRLHWPGQLGGMPIEQAVQKVRDRRIGELLALDQLNLMRQDGMAFDGFEELPIHFLPSYKWRPGGDALDMRSQKHVPAWTDRILSRSVTRPPAQAYRYDMFLGLKQSDHRAVFCCFTVPWDGPTDSAQAADGVAGGLSRTRASMGRGGLNTDPVEPVLVLQPTEVELVEVHHHGGLAACTEQAAWSREPDAGAEDADH